MENISLTSRRKEELLTLWVAFKGRFSGDEMDGQDLDIVYVVSISIVSLLS